MASERRRVVITGLGAVSPLGLSARETWTAALEGRSGVGLITSFDTSDAPVKIAAEVKNFDFNGAVGPFRPAPGVEITQISNSKEARRVGRFVHLATAAGLEAYGDSGLDSYRDRIAPERMAINIGVGMGGLPEIESVHNDYLAKGYRRITPFFIPQAIPNLAAGQLSILLHLKGANQCVVTACASSAHSIGESTRWIQRGDADVVVSGGAEAVICKLSIGGFAAMRALSTRNDTPETASRPYDVSRDGFIIGEGAAVLILEEYEHAKKRGAKIYAEVLGYGATSDAYHITTPAEDGEGGKRAMEIALRDAQLNPEQIGYVNSHGTSTPAGDVEEARAIAQIFASAKDKLHVSSTKSMTGHLLGAAGALEAMFCTYAIREGKIPPTMHVENLDPACASLGLDFTLGRAIDKKFEYALSNSFGFGGTNGSLILGKI